MFEKLMPTRKERPKIYANLDRLISEPLWFELHGKTHKFRPVTVEEFYKIVNALSAFHDMQKDESLTPDEVIDTCFEMFSSICDTIKRDDVQKMNKIQVGALYQILNEHITGKAHNLDQDELKKKTMAMFNSTKSTL